MGMTYLAERTASSVVELEHQLSLLTEVAHDGATSVTSPLMAGRIGALTEDLASAGGDLHRRMQRLTYHTNDLNLPAMVVETVEAAVDTMLLNQQISLGFYGFSKRSTFDEIGASSGDGRTWIARLYELAEAAQHTLGDVGNHLTIFAQGTADLMAVQRPAPPPPDKKGTS